MNDPRESTGTAPAVSRPTRRRRRVALVSAASAVVISVAGTLALKFVPSTSSVVYERADSALPQVDSASTQAAVSSVPDRARAVLAQVNGPTGRWSGTSGAADTITKAPAPVDGRFRQGSVTKTFIATVVWRS